MRQGYELNYKLISLPVGKHQGALPAEHSFLQVAAENVIVSAHEESGRRKRAGGSASMNGRASREM